MLSHDVDVGREPGANRGRRAAFSACCGWHTFTVEEP
jgi:hypothetical protein